MHNPEVERGLLKDLGEALGAELKIKPTWILHAIWQPTIQDEVQWSSELYPSTKCAVSKKSKVTVSQVNRAIDAIKKNGTYQKILKTYTDVH